MLHFLHARLFEHDRDICSSTNWLEAEAQAQSPLLLNQNHIQSGSPTQSHASKLNMTHKVCIEFAKAGLVA